MESRSPEEQRARWKAHVEKLNEETQQVPFESEASKGLRANAENPTGVKPIKDATSPLSALVDQSIQGQQLPKDLRRARAYQHAETDGIVNSAQRRQDSGEPSQK